MEATSTTEIIGHNPRIDPNVVAKFNSLEAKLPVIARVKTGADYHITPPLARGDVLIPKDFASKFTTNSSLPGSCFGTLVPEAQAPDV